MVIEVFKQSQELSLQPAAVKLKEKGLIPPPTESSKHSCQTHQALAILNALVVTTRVRSAQNIPRLMF